MFYYPCPETPQDTSLTAEEHIDVSTEPELTTAHDRQGEESERVLDSEEDQVMSDLLVEDRAPEQLDNGGDSSLLPPVSPPSCGSHSGEEQGQDRSKRERRPPKRFTYDELGYPVCYNLGLPARSSYGPDTVHYYGPLQPRSMWTDPIQMSTYQPVLLYG